MNISFVKYTVKFAPMPCVNGIRARHQYTKQIGKDVTEIDFKEYFNAMTKSEEKYNEYYGYAYGTFSITEEQYKNLNP